MYFPTIKKLASVVLYALYNILPPFIYKVYLNPHTENAKYIIFLKYGYAFDYLSL